MHIVCENVEAIIPLSSLIDPEKEKARIQKEIERAENEISRSKAKLGNEGFVAKAPENVVEAERTKLAAAEDMLCKLRERMEALL